MANGQEPLRIGHQPPFSVLAERRDPARWLGEVVQGASSSRSSPTWRTLAYLHGRYQSVGSPPDDG